jgi:hypothetical protein
MPHNNTSTPVSVCHAQRGGRNYFSLHLKADHYQHANSVYQLLKNDLTTDGLVLL